MRDKAIEKLIPDCVEITGAEVQKWLDVMLKAWATVLDKAGAVATHELTTAAVLISDSQPHPAERNHYK